MSTYYFHLHDDKNIVDTDGTDLPNVDAAREHAAGVARELTAHSIGFLDQNWSGWTMSVQDDGGVQLFSLAMSDFRDENRATESRVADSKFCPLFLFAKLKVRVR